MNTPETGSMSVIVVGSFRKHMVYIWQASQLCTSSGIEVVSPRTSELVNPQEEFVFLASDDPQKSARRLQVDVMRKMRNVDFLLVANAEGYIGESTAAEMSYACIKRVPILASEPIQKFSDNILPSVTPILRRSVHVIEEQSNIQQLVTDIKYNRSSLKYTLYEEKLLHKTVVSLLSNLSSKRS